jgi:hypothetical protein
MFSYFSYIPMFKTTIPTANPLSIQSFPVGYLNHHKLAIFALMHKNRSLERTTCSTESTVKTTSTIQTIQSFRRWSSDSGFMLYIAFFLLMLCTRHRGHGLVFYSVFHILAGDIPCNSYTNATCQAELLEHTQPQQTPCNLTSLNNNNVTSNIFPFLIIAIPSWNFSLNNHCKEPEQR